MGGPICRNVVTKHAGPVWAFDISADALREAGEAGAKWRHRLPKLRPMPTWSSSRCPAASRSRRCAWELASAARPGLTIIDLSTTAVAEARDIAARLSEQGIQFIDAPVARTRQAAIDGTLSIMVGASPEQFAPASSR